MKSTGCLPDVLAPWSLPALLVSALSEGAGGSADVCHWVGCKHRLHISELFQGRHVDLQCLQRADRLSC